MTEIPLDAVCDCGDSYRDHFVTFGGISGCYGSAECPCDGWQEPVERAPVPRHPASCACSQCVLAQVWADDLVLAVEASLPLARLLDRWYEREISEEGAKPERVLD